LSEYEKFFFIDPNPRRIVQEYSCIKHASDSVCDRCGRIYFEHGEIIEFLYLGKSNIKLHSVVCVGDIVVKFDNQNFAAATAVTYEMDWEDWADLFRWKTYLVWLWVTRPYRYVKNLFKKKQTK